MRPLITIAVGLWALGCAPEAAPPPRVTEVQPLTRAEAAPRPSRDLPVPAEIGPRAALPAALEGQREVIDAVPMPVLAPVEAMKGATRARLTPWSGGYTLSIRFPDHHVVVQGSHRAYARPHLAAELKEVMPQGEPHITQSHQIYSAHIQRFGLSYLVDLECGRPLDDPRCLEEGAIRGLLEQLEVIGGQP